jgi:hypothetical protein
VLCFFSKKNILIPNVAEKNILILVEEKKKNLEDMKFHKHLGVTISDDGSWNKHIELVIDKAYSRLNILRIVTCQGW